VLIEWGVAARSLANHAESGDQYVVEPHPNGALTAVIDGLGHGDKAAAAAKTAVATLKQNFTEPVVDLLRLCHQQLRQSRGVVMSLASFDGPSSSLTWLGVGNVEGILIHHNGRSTLSLDGGSRSPASQSLLLQGGIVGYRLPNLRPVTMSLSQGDVLIFTTDGIRSGFVRTFSQDRAAQSLDKKMPAPHMAQTILDQYGRETDDALVLVVRYLGRQD
jgi:serine/threonine protein phosphatase PrpC